MALAVLLTVLTACSPVETTRPAPVTVPSTTATSAPQPTPGLTAGSATTAPSSAPPARSVTAPPTPTSTASQDKDACLKDESQCYEPGTNVKCQTGGCVNAARGLTPSDIEAARRRWLREHPGWCAVGTQGAVAPC
ncbi:hypothetical protein GCM10023192_06160 [Amycolatopsis samaneae]